MGTCCAFFLLECCGSLAYVKHNNMMQYWKWSLQAHVREIEIYCIDMWISPGTWAFSVLKRYIFSCHQAALWMVFFVCLSVCLSVCPSVRPSVCLSVRLSVFLSVCLSVCLSVRLSVTPFWLCSHHRIIIKFSGFIAKDQGNVHAKGQGQRSKVKVTGHNPT